MRVLFISTHGAALGLAHHVAQEGHNVDVFIADARLRLSGLGLVNRVGDWRAALRRADLTVADGVGLGRYEDIVRQTNRPTVGFSAALDTLQLDGAKCAEMFDRAGIQTLPQSLDASSGDGPARSSGVQVAVGSWFNGSAFVRPFTYTFADRRLFAGDLGPLTAGMGSVVVRADGGRLVDHTLARVEPLLRLLGYRGPFGIDAVVRQDGTFAVGVTTALSDDAVFEGLDEPLGDFLFDTAMGTKREMTLSADTLISVRLSVPPWPQQSLNGSGRLVEGIDEQALAHLFLAHVTRDGESYTTAGGDGVVLTATARGAVTPPKPLNNGKRSRPDYTYEARRRVYRLLDKIAVPDKQYRTDIGVRVNGDIAQLKEWGWL